MVTLEEKQINKMENMARDIKRLLEGKYKISITCSHSFETGEDILLIKIPVQKTVGLPLLKQTDWAALLEGTLFHDKEMDAAVRAVFYRLNAETRRYLILFMPDTPCGWLERARFWSEILRPALPPKMYHEAMIRLCSWYRHCIDLRKEKSARISHSSFAQNTFAKYRSGEYCRFLREIEDADSLQELHCGAVAGARNCHVWSGAAEKRR